MNPAPTVLQRRIVIGAAMCVAAFALVGARLTVVSLLKSGAEVSAPNAPSARNAVGRADLADRNGELVARDLPADDLYAHPHLFADPRLAARLLASVTGADEPRLAQMV